MCAHVFLHTQPFFFFFSRAKDIHQVIPFVIDSSCLLYLLSLLLQERKRFHRSPEHNSPSSREVRGSLGNLELQHVPATHTHSTVCNRLRNSRDIKTHERFNRTVILTRQYKAMQIFNAGLLFKFKQHTNR